MSCGRKDLEIDFESNKKRQGNNENKILKAKEKLCKHSDQTKPEKFKNIIWFSVFKNNVRGAKDQAVVQQTDILPEDFIERCEIGPQPTDNNIGDTFIPKKEKEAKKDNKLRGCIKCLQ